MQKTQYRSPVVLQETAILLEQAFLAGSVVDKMNEGGVVTKTQDVTNQDFDNGSEYNFKWEE